MYRRSLEILIKVSRDFIDEGNTSEKEQVKVRKREGKKSIRHAWREENCRSLLLITIN